MSQSEPLLPLQVFMAWTVKPFTVFTFLYKCQRRYLMCFNVISSPTTRIFRNTSVRTSGLFSKHLCRMKKAHDLHIGSRLRTVYSPTATEVAIYELLLNVMAPIRLSEDALRNLNCSKLRTAHALLTMLVTREGLGGGCLRSRGSGCHLTKSDS